MDQPKNLEEAVLVELEKQDIFPIIDVTGHLVFTKTWTAEQLKTETNEALKTLKSAGSYEASTGIGRGVSEYLKRKKDGFSGKKV